MERITLFDALRMLPDRLANFNKQIGPYVDHTSTTKGITLKTLSGTLFLYHSFIYKIVYYPDSITETDLKSIALNFK